MLCHHKRSKCYVIINGQKSGPVPIKRGVRQGGVASTLYYLVYIDELLRELEQSESSLRLYSPINANCGIPAFADDLAIISLTPDHLQNLLDIVYRYTYKWKLDINCKKSTIVVFNNEKKKFSTTIYLR